MLESSSFDFRSRHPQHLLIKLCKGHDLNIGDAVAKTAYSLSIDLYRTFAPLKQTTVTLAFACVDLACRLHGRSPVLEKIDIRRWKIGMAEIFGRSSLILDTSVEKSGA